MPRTHVRWQALRDLGLGDRVQGRIALQAQRERPRAAGEVEAREQLRRLALGLQRMDEAAVGELAALQQLAVAGQHDAAFAAGDGDDLGIIAVVVVERVEAGQAQQAREAAEVGVGDEAGDAQRRGAHAQQRRHVEGLEAGIDRHPVAVAQQALEADRFAIDQHQLDLGMRHAQRLDHVLDRGGAGAAGLERVPPVIRREEVVEFLVEAERGDDRLGVGWGRAAVAGLGRRVGRRIVSGVWNGVWNGVGSGVGSGGRGGHGRHLSGNP